MDAALEITVFRAIADPARRSILDLLAQGEKAVSELLAHFSFSQPALSKHLKLLIGAGLVSRRAEGRTRVYRLQADGLQRVHDWVSHYEAFWTRKLDELGAVLDDMPDS